MSLFLRHLLGLCPLVSDFMNTHHARLHLPVNAVGPKLGSSGISKAATATASAISCTANIMYEDIVVQRSMKVVQRY